MSRWRPASVPGPESVTRCVAANGCRPNPVIFVEANRRSIGSTRRRTPHAGTASRSGAAASRSATHAQAPATVSGRRPRRPPTRHRRGTGCPPAACAAADRAGHRRGPVPRARRAEPDHVERKERPVGWPARRACGAPAEPDGRARAEGEVTGGVGKRAEQGPRVGIGLGLANVVGAHHARARPRRASPSLAWLLCLIAIVGGIVSLKFVHRPAPDHRAVGPGQRARGDARPHMCSPKVRIVQTAADTGDPSPARQVSGGSGRVQSSGRPHGKGVRLRLGRQR